MKKLFPDQWLQQQARQSKALQRQGKVNIVALFWTLVLGIPTSKQRSIAELRREYERRTGTKLEESSFYDRFHFGLVELMRRAVFHALEMSSELSQAAIHTTAFFREILAIDSTVLRLHELLQDPYAGTRINHSPAAAKLHMVLNVSRAGASSVRLTSARTDDRSPWQRLGPWVRGRLLLMDLGYFCYQLFARIEDNGGFFLSRLKGKVNPLIVSNNLQCRGQALELEGARGAGCVAPSAA